MGVWNRMIELTKGRDASLQMGLRNPDGSPRPLTTIDLFCEVKRDVDDATALVTLSSTSGGILKNTAPGAEHRFFLQFTPTVTNSIPLIQTDNDLQFPFTKLVAEVYYVEDGVRKPGLMFPIRLLQGVANG